MKLYKLTFYLQSGNEFTIDGVDSYEIGRSTIVLTQRNGRQFKKVIVNSIDLTRVEAITENRYVATVPVSDLSDEEKKERGL